MADCWRSVPRIDKTIIQQNVLFATSETYFFSTLLGLEHGQPFPPFPIISRGRSPARASSQGGASHRHEETRRGAYAISGRLNAKATGLYDRRNDEVSLDEGERIGI
jgi:hypothetical protein